MRAIKFRSTLYRISQLLAKTECNISHVFSGSVTFIIVSRYFCNTFVNNMRSNIIIF